MVDELSGSRLMSGSLDERDRKRPRVSGKSNDTAVDLRERNSRSSYDNTVKGSSPGHNYSHYDKEKREIRDTDRSTLQKLSSKSRISVWNRIEESPSLVASPSSSNLSNRASAQQVSQENKPETEASGQSVALEKGLGPGLKAAEVSTEVTGKKKKKVVIRRRIVKKKGKSKIDDSTISSSSPVDPIAEGTGSDNVAGGKRRVKRVLLVKKKKGTKAPGETSVCNEEIVRQIVDGVFSEKKSGECSWLSPEKSADEIQSKIDDGRNTSQVTFVKNSCISDGMIGTSHMEMCTKEEIIEAPPSNKVSNINDIESVLENPSNLGTARQNEEKEIDFTIGSPADEDCVEEKEVTFTIGSPVGEHCVEDKNKAGDIPIDEDNEMTSPRFNYGIENEKIENKMQVDIPKEEEIQLNHSITEEKTNGEKNQETENCPCNDTLQLEIPKEGEPASVCALTKEKLNVQKDQETKNYPCNDTLQLEIPKEQELASVYALTVSGLDNWLQLRPQEMSSSDLVLGQYLPQTDLEFNLCKSNSSPQIDNEGNGVRISTEINENKISDNKNNLITTNELSGSAIDGENVDKAKFNQEGIQKNQKETQKPVYQKSVSVSPVPKFPVQKPRHRTWRRENNDCVTPGLSAPNQLPKPSSKRDTLPQNSYIRKGNSLIRSASNTTVPTKSSIPRIPSPNPNRAVFDMSREVTAISSPVHESEGEEKRSLDKGGIQNSSNKVVYFKKRNNQIVLNNGHSSDSQNLKAFIPLENAASTSNSNSDDNRDLVHYLSDSGMMGFVKKSIHKGIYFMLSPRY
jgi:Fibritin C-terminal region